MTAIIIAIISIIFNSYPSGHKGQYGQMIKIDPFLGEFSMRTSLARVELSSSNTQTPKERGY